MSVVAAAVVRGTPAESAGVFYLVGAGLVQGFDLADDQVDVEEGAAV
jgi:hypothetical protein